MNVSKYVSINSGKYFLSFLAVLIIFTAQNVIISSVFAADYVGAKLSEIEKSYYGYTLSGTYDSRLSRLENAIYGSLSKKPQKTRVEKIYNDLNLGVNTGGAAPVNTSSNNYNTQQASAPIQEIGPKAESGIKYPVVDAMEQRAFKKAFADEDIYARLSRLEKQAFSGSRQKESTLSLNERVDALRGKILGGTQNNSGSVDIDPSTEEIVLENGQKYYGDDDAKFGFNNDENDEDSHYNYYSYENSKNRIPETKSKFDTTDGDGGAYAEHYAQNYDLDILEKNLLGKRYESEVPQKRLARLESKVFDRTFSDAEEARIQRLLAVTTAQKTSQEYDSNKWARRLNTGIQIGSILLMVLAIIL